MVGRWMVCVLALTACTDSGGGRTMIDAPVGGTGGSGGGDGNGCRLTCSAPGSSTFCVTGTVHLFANPSIVAGPTAESNVVVKIYDPIAFATNPGGSPAATVNVEQQGCFIADGIPRFSSGLVAIVTDDAPRAGDGYVTMAVSATLQANQNVIGVRAYFEDGLTVVSWQDQVGNPAGCAAGFFTCGLFLGEYVDSNGCPVANLQPVRPGDNPPPANIFCFGADRTMLTTNDFTSDVGICGISPDAFEGHTGACAAGGCTCCGNPCTPTFPTTTAGAAPGVIFVQAFVASP